MLYFHFRASQFWEYMREKWRHKVVSSLRSSREPLSPAGLNFSHYWTIVRLLVGAGVWCVPIPSEASNLFTERGVTAPQCCQHLLPPWTQKPQHWRLGLWCDHWCHPMSPWPETQTWACWKEQSESSGRSGGGHLEGRDSGSSVTCGSD